MRWPGGLRRRDRAVAAVEFALTAPGWILLLGISTELGFAIKAQTMISNALSAAAQYAVQQTQKGNAVPDSNTLKAMVQSISALSGVTVTVSGPAYYCLTGTAPTLTASSSGATCGDGSLAGQYLQLSASYVTPVWFTGGMNVLHPTIGDSVWVRVS